MALVRKRLLLPAEEASLGSSSSRTYPSTCSYPNVPPPFALTHSPARTLTPKCVPPPSQHVCGRVDIYEVYGDGGVYSGIQRDMVVHMHAPRQRATATPPAPPDMTHMSRSSSALQLAGYLRGGVGWDASAHASAPARSALGLG